MTFKPQLAVLALAVTAVLQAHAVVEPSEQAWDLLGRLTKVYLTPDAEFPAPKGPGYLVRYQVERIRGVGPWA